MAAAVDSRAISSLDLICRASSITCWPSRMSMCCFCSSKKVGTSAKSTPTGSFLMPGLLQAVLDLGDLPGGEPGRGRGGAAHGGVGGDAVLRLEPRAVEPVVHGGRAEVPQDQLAGAGVQRVPAQLVPGPLADRDAGQVPDVVVVEDEQRAEAGLFHGLPGPVQAVPAEPGEVDPLLEVDVHPARRRGEGKSGNGAIRHAGLLCSCITIQRPVQCDCQAGRGGVCSVDLHYG